MKRFRVIVLPAAERDILEIHLRFAQYGNDVATRWYNRLIEVILSLETFPERCPFAPENKYIDHEIREIFHGRRQPKYRILFTVSEDEVNVLHVRHGARLALHEIEFPE